MPQTIKKIDLIRVIVNLIKEAQLVYNLGHSENLITMEEIMNELNKI